MKRALEELVMEAYSYETDEGVPFKTYLERCFDLYSEADQHVRVLLLLREITHSGGEIMTMERFYSVCPLTTLTLQREADRALVEHIETHGIGVNVQWPRRVNAGFPFF